MGNKKVNKEQMKQLLFWSRFKTNKIKKLLKTGFNPDTVYEDGETFFMIAVWLGLYRAVKAMTKHGANCKLKNNDRKNMFLLACESGNMKTVKFFLKKGFDINSVSSEKNNGLMLAVISGKTNLISYLCKKGIDINEQNRNGQTALILSVEKEKIINPAIDKKIIKHKIKIFKKLLKNGANINVNDNSGKTVLSYTVLRGDMQWFKYLYKKKADINASKQNLFLLTAGMPIFKDAIKENMISFLKTHGAKQPPFSFQYKVKAKCSECSRYITLYTPTQNVQCDSCLSITKLDNKFWERIFDYSVYPYNDYRRENTCHVEINEIGPLCSNCGEELDTDNYTFGTEEPLICKKCNEINAAFPAPEWMKNFSVCEFKPKHIFCTSKEEQNIQTEGVKPIAFKCSSCSAALSITKATDKNFKCEHCGTEQKLPDDLWTALHHAKKRKPWYIWFSDK